MTIQQCKYVLAIAKAGSFSEAAKQLFVAQSSLSLSVKTLEQELGIRIFERSGNGVYMSEEGAEFVRYAAQMVVNSEFITQRYSSRTVKHRLYIVTQHYDFIADIFGHLLRETEEESYRFSIREVETYTVIHELETARSDIGIIAIKAGDQEIMKRYLSKKGLLFTPLLQAAPHVFLRREHPLAKRESLTFAELREYPYVSYEQGEHTGSFFTEEMMDASSADKHIEISDRATLMNVLLVTDAYTVGTGIMPSALNRGDIISVPLVSDEGYTIGYLLNKERRESEMTRRFIRLLEEASATMGKEELP